MTCKICGSPKVENRDTMLCGGTVLGIAFACYAMITHGIYFPTVGCMVCSILFERVKMDNTTWWVEVADFAFIEMGIFQLITLGI